MARIDLHFHILPGIDDGPPTLADALELARAALADGTRAVAATPHVRPDHLTDVAELPERVAELRDALAAAGLPLEVEVGGELAHTMVGRLSQADLETIALGPPEGRWLLLEAPFGGIDDDFSAAADELRRRGFGVVIAHPERSGSGLDAVWAEVARGALPQVNAGSLAGWHGERAAEIARRLVTRGMAALIASDAHSPQRPPALTRAVDLAGSVGIGRSAAEALVSARPARLLARGIARPLVAA